MPEAKYEYKGDAVDRLLASYQSDRGPFSTVELPFPEVPNGRREVGLLKGLFFSNYWRNGAVTRKNGRDELGQQVDELGQLFFDQVRGYSARDVDGRLVVSPRQDIDEIVTGVIDQLPDIRKKLKKDVEAGYAGDPAAGSNPNIKDSPESPEFLAYTQIIKDYPGFAAVEVYRVAHVFYELGAGGYARSLTEHIHSKTGIDIHPGAEIDEFFFIDHGTGVVIGETSDIEQGVRLYQGVTLGALSLKHVDSKRGAKRHPTIRKGGIIYAGATILGGDTIIGEGSVIGGNTWITKSIDPGSKAILDEPPHQRIENRNGGGI